MEERLGSAADRGRRIALVGLRGAGKSTLGRKLAEHLGVPFLELNRVIEQNHGASVAVLIELSGLATFRKYEHECLQRVIAEHDAAVIATAGGIVANPQTYELLLRRTHAIWIKARPEEHMARVIAQGDFRPMAHNREAMGDLVAILDARSADYSRAEIATRHFRMLGRTKLCRPGAARRALCARALTERHRQTARALNEERTPGLCREGDGTPQA